MSFEPSLTVTHAITADLTRIERSTGVPGGGDALRLKPRDERTGARARGAPYDPHRRHQADARGAGGAPRGAVVPEADPDDVRELLNYRDAFEFVSTWLGGGGPVTEGWSGRSTSASSRRPGRVGRAGRVPADPELNYVVNAATREVVYIPPPAHDVPILTRGAGIGQSRSSTSIRSWTATAERRACSRPSACTKPGTISSASSPSANTTTATGPQFYRAIQGVREQDMDLTGWLEFFTAGLATQLGQGGGAWRMDDPP